MSYVIEVMQYDRQQIARLEESGEKEVFEKRLQKRIQSVLDLAAGRRHLGNAFGLIQSRELFHAEVDNLIDGTWVAGKALGTGNTFNNLGQGLVYEALKKMRLQQIKETVTDFTDPNEGPRILQEDTLYEATDGTGVVVRKVLIGNHWGDPSYEAAGLALYGTPWFDTRIDVLVPKALSSTEYQK